MANLKPAGSFSIPHGLLNGLLAFLTTCGTVTVLILQARSANRVAELKAASDKQEETLKQVHVLTNTNFSQQKAQLESQAAEMKDMRATITRLETMLSEQQKKR